MQSNLSCRRVKAPSGHNRKPARRDGAPARLCRGHTLHVIDWLEYPGAVGIVIEGPASLSSLHGQRLSRIGAHCCLISWYDLKRNAMYECALIEGRSICSCPWAQTHTLSPCIHAQAALALRAAGQV
jgi:hypothetical protein